MDYDILPFSDQPVYTPDPPKPTPPPKYVPVYYNSTGNNAQQDGVNSLKRIEFEFKGETYRFVLNPEQLTQEEPNRATVVQTKGGAWVDDFGGGLVTIAFKGTTGFKNRSGIGTDGFEKFKKLRDMIRRYYFKQVPGTEVRQKDELKFHNHTDGESWIVVPKTFSLMRSVARPLLYLYDIQLIAIRPAKLPNYVFDAGVGAKMSLSRMIGNESRNDMQADLTRGIIKPPHSSTPVETVTTTVVPKILTHQTSSSLEHSIGYSRTVQPRDAYTADADDAYWDDSIHYEYTGKGEDDSAPILTVSYSTDEEIFSGYAKPQIPTDLVNSIMNLGEILGDYGGRLTPSTISVALKDLDIIPPGIMSSGETIKAYGLENSGKMPFLYTDYIVRIPYSTYEVYSRLQQGGKDLVLQSDLYSGEIVSPLLIEMDVLPWELKLATQALYVETYTMYIDLLTFTRGGCPISYTRMDVEDFLHNIDWLCNQISCLEGVSSYIPIMDTLSLLRRSIAFCKEYTAIFTGTSEDNSYITSNRCMPGYTPPKTIVKEVR